SGRASRQSFGGFGAPAGADSLATHFPSCTFLLTGATRQRRPSSLLGPCSFDTGLPLERNYSNARSCPSVDNSLMEVSHSFDECDVKSFERYRSTVLPGWLAGISKGGLYDGNVEELGALALGMQVSRGVRTEVSSQSGLWRDPRELGRDLS